MGLFKGLLTYMHRNNGQGMLGAKINLLVKSHMPEA